MQSGTTGINTIRIYNPIKQGLDQDAKGTFVRQWVPELKDIDHDFIHTPWLSPNKPKGYPPPIVDEKTSRQTASKKLYAVKGKPEHKEIAREVYVKHGSRKGKQSTKRTRISPKNKLQGELNF
jgi:deoxyribodipyrimidine photo-lyase